jgi:hypothetical protein
MLDDKIGRLISALGKHNHVPIWLERMQLRKKTKLN